MARRSKPDGSSPSSNREPVSAPPARIEPANRPPIGHSRERPACPPSRVRVPSPLGDQMSISGPAWTRTATTELARLTSTVASGAISYRSSAPLRIAPAPLFSTITSGRASAAATPVHAHAEAGRVVRPDGGRVGGGVTRRSAVVGSRGLEGDTPLRREARQWRDAETERQCEQLTHHRISSLIQPFVTSFSPFTTQL